MNESSIKILLIEDNLAQARLLKEILKSVTFKQFDLFHVKRLKEGLNRLQKDSFDVILLDLTLPDSQGLASLTSIINCAPSLPIVVLTNTNDDRLAIEAVRQGAQDYLVKRDVKGEMLVRSLCYAIERKQVSESLRQMNQALENRVRERTAELVKATELNQMKSEFVSMISHDFRNPLNVILAYTGLLEDTNYKLTEEKKQTHLRLIRSAIKSMAQLLDEVSLIGKADTGKLECQLIPLNLEIFCCAILEEVEVSMGKTHQIVFRSKGKFLEDTLWDESLLRHILGNLLVNAVKYSPKGSVIDFEMITQKNAVIFKITDRGIGIPIEDQKRLFQPFSRAGNVGSVPGSGLGLAIVKKCVEVCDGEISVHSQVGMGTTFTVKLPLVVEVVETRDFLPSKSEI